MAGNTNFDSILATTLANYASTLVDNVFSARPLVAWLQRKDKIKMVSGGAKIVQQLMYAQNQAAGSYSGYDTLPLTASAGISAAEYPWKQFAATIAINGLEEAENSGEEAIIDLLEAKISQAEETISEQMDVMFLADGSGNGGKDWMGLAGIVSVSDPSVGALGNIPVSGNTWWESVVVAAATNGTALTLSTLSHTFNTASRGNDAPDFILSGQVAFEKYESLLNPQLRFTDTKTADAGFQNLLYKTAPWMYDINIASYTQGSQAGVTDIYMLNSKYLKLVGHSSRWFTSTPFKSAPNQDARFAQILCYGNLTVSNRARQASIKAVF